jgi:hypothetical protein
MRRLPGDAEVDEVAMDECMNEEEDLGLLGRFESLHLPFPATCWSMGVLRRIVQISALSVLDGEKQVMVGHGGQMVNDPGRVDLLG